jgi:hypothetical protein
MASTKFSNGNTWLAQHFEDCVVLLSPNDGKADLVNMHPGSFLLGKRAARGCKVARILVP